MFFRFKIVKMKCDSSKSTTRLSKSSVVEAMYIQSYDNDVHTHTHTHNTHNTHTTHTHNTHTTTHTHTHNTHT